MTALETSPLNRDPQSSPPEGLLTAFINRFATPLVTGLFLVSAISGVALFFHWSPDVFHTMHLWLSMVLLAPFVLHVWKNWNTLLGYARRKTLIVPMAACLLVALPFAFFGSPDDDDDDGNPAFQTVSLMTQARLSDLAPILKTTPNALLAILKQRGYRARSTDQTLDSIAAASGKKPTDVLLAVMPTSSATRDGYVLTHTPTAPR